MGRVRGRPIALGTRRAAMTCSRTAGKSALPWANSAPVDESVQHDQFLLQLFVPRRGRAVIAAGSVPAHRRYGAQAGPRWGGGGGGGRSRGRFGEPFGGAGQEGRDAGLHGRPGHRGANAVSGWRRPSSEGRPSARTTGRGRRWRGGLRHRSARQEGSRHLVPLLATWRSTPTAFLLSAEPGARSLRFPTTTARGGGASRSRWS